VKWKGRGSYTVEGTVIICCICFITGLIIVAGFYCHDRMVLQSTADELSMYGSFWTGRAVHPGTGEVDYEAMKSSADRMPEVIEEKGYQMLEGKLLWGHVSDISIERSLFGTEILVEIQGGFSVGQRQIDCRVEAAAMIFKSEDLPRRPKPEQGGAENGVGEPQG